jgi:hypothetical protein
MCDTGPHGRFDVYLRTILERQIKDPFSDIYEKSGLPAYTMQRRCGADVELRELYLTMRPDAKEKVAKYLEKRAREQEQFQKRNPGSSAKRTND